MFQLWWLISALCLVKRSKLLERPVRTSGVFRWESERAADDAVRCGSQESEPWFVNVVDHFRPEGRGREWSDWEGRRGRGLVGLDRAEGRRVLCGAEI